LGKQIPRIAKNQVEADVEFRSPFGQGERDL
jgi:hypothetical protein